MRTPYAWYGDDFTGASDTLAWLSAGGARALLYLDEPTPERLEAAGPLDAVGVAGIARALSPDAMRAELAPIARCFARLAPAITHYKCCSTFDSAVGTGNLAVGVAALRRPEHDAVLAVFGGQPSLERYCAFGELHASAQAGGEVYRIDRHPTMSRHPVTPMHEADLRRHLAALGLAKTGLVDLRAFDAAQDDPDRFDEAVARAIGHSPVHAHASAAAHATRHATMRVPASPPDALLFDTTHARHLETLGRWLWRRAAMRPQLVLGASGVAQAALTHWPSLPDARPISFDAAPAASPVFLLVGSLSPVTALQVQQAKGLYEEVSIDPEALLADAAALPALARRCSLALAHGRSVMARTTPPRADVLAPLTVARLSADLLTQVLALSPQVRRIGVAGGDTSSLALRALGAWAIRWSGGLAHGIALKQLRADNPALDGLELMLKGGQIGPPDVFVRLLVGAGQAGGRRS